MNKVAIVYFSGTGNTQVIAELIKNQMADRHVALYRVENVLHHIEEAKLSNYDILGIGFPSYGFNAPLIITEFVKRLKNTRNHQVFLFLTCAGPCYLNDVAAFGVKRILTKKGYEIIYEKVICMPANVLLRYDDELIKRLYDAAIQRTRWLADDISNHVRKIRNDRFLPYLFRWLFVPLEKIAFKLFPLDFTVTKECNQCLKCVRSCPRKNITLKGKIKHGLKCEVCYRCVYTCPRQAIKGRLYNLAIVKDGYNIHEKIETIQSMNAGQPLKGIYKTLESYFNESNF